MRGAVILTAALGLCLAGGVARAASWSCVRTDDGSQNPGAACGPYRYRSITNSTGYNTYVLNDVWNPPGRGHPQTVYANNPGDWQVRSDQPAGNTAVLSYPDVQQIFTTTRNTPAALRDFQTISSSFTESMPSNGDNEAAYDIWMGKGQSTNYAQEVMIWVDNHRTNPPPGRIVARVDFDAVNYAVWEDRTDGGAGFHTIYMVRNHNAHSGTVNVLAMLNWLVRHKLTTAIGLNQLNFGWEICSTDGKRETFTISRYDIRLRCKTGGNGCFAG